MAWLLSLDLRRTDQKRRIRHCSQYRGQSGRAGRPAGHRQSVAISPADNRPENAAAPFWSHPGL